MLVTAVVAAASVSATPLRDRAAPCLEVRVYDTARTAPSDLDAARARVEKIYRDAGVQIDWLNCSTPVPTGRCARVPDPAAVLVRIIRQAGPARDVLGDSLIDS